MSLNQEQGNQIYRAALIYPFVILVLGFISIMLSDNFLDALPKEEDSNPTAAPNSERLSAEKKSENEAVLITMPDNPGQNPSSKPSESGRDENAMQQDRSSGDIPTSKGQTKNTTKPTTKYPPVMIPGLIIQVVQIYLFHQISSITKELVRAKNDISFKVVCGIGFVIATIMIMASIGKLNSVYASAQAGRRVQYRGKELRAYEIFSVISALVIVYSWGQLAWA